MWWGVYFKLKILWWARRRGEVYTSPSSILSREMWIQPRFIDPYSVSASVRWHASLIGAQHPFKSRWAGSPRMCSTRIRWVAWWWRITPLFITSSIDVPSSMKSSAQGTRFLKITDKSQFSLIILMNLIARKRWLQASLTNIKKRKKRTISNGVRLFKFLLFVVCVDELFCVRFGFSRGVCGKWRSSYASLCRAPRRFHRLNYEA